MRQAMKHRSRGQTLVLAVLFMVGLVGALGLVIDVGMILVIQKQLQNAADAGALAGAWYAPVCPNTNPTNMGCRTDQTSDTVAVQVTTENLAIATTLCGSVDTPQAVDNPPNQPLNLPQNVNWIEVTVSCNYSYSFARILQLGQPKLIRAQAIAAIGDRSNTGDMSSFAVLPSNPNNLPCSNPDIVPPCLVARLLD